MRTATLRALGILLTLAFATACGGGDAASDDSSDDDWDDTTGDEDVTPGDSTEGHQSARELIGINGPEQPWSEMSHEDREMDMVARFHPIFREMFQEHDAEEFAEFGCGDCHGPGISDGNFDMPSAHLPAVPAAGTPEFQALHDNEEEHAMFEFMEHEVTPAMQTMLGMGETFTCNGCHPTQ